MAGVHHFLDPVFGTFRDDPVRSRWFWTWKVLATRSMPPWRSRWSMWIADDDDWRIFSDGDFMRFPYFGYPKINLSYWLWLEKAMIWGTIFLETSAWKFRTSWKNRMEHIKKLTQHFGLVNGMSTAYWVFAILFWLQGWHSYGSNTNVT